MLEDQDMRSLIISQIEAAVEKYVAAVLSDSKWQQDFENRVTRHVQDRITAKFANISSVPEINDAIQLGVESLFAKGVIPGIDQYLDHDRLRKVLSSNAENAVEKISRDITLDQEWLLKLQQSLTQSMTQRLLRQISDVDINSVITDAIDQGIDRWQDRLMSKLRTGGIIDTAGQCELTVVDGAVVISNTLVTESLLAQQDIEVHGAAKIKDLVVTGTVNVDCKSWRELADHSADLAKQKLIDQWRQDLIDDVLARAKDSGINFDHVLINGSPVIDGHTLNAAVTDTNIQSLGTLRDLTVNGKTQLGETLYAHNRRLGINTRDPEMALTLWDEEISVVVGKQSQNTAFIGTSRRQAIGLGVNRKAELLIDDQGLTTVRNLRIDKWRIQHSDLAPGWSGTKGDFVINSNPSEKSAFAWICLGGYRWQQLMAKS